MSEVERIVRAEPYAFSCWWKRADLKWQRGPLFYKEADAEDWAKESDDDVICEILPLYDRAGSRAAAGIPLASEDRGDDGWRRAEQELRDAAFSIACRYEHPDSPTFAREADAILGTLRQHLLPAPPVASHHEG